MSNEKKCNAQTEVYSRVVGFYRPVRNWNSGKINEFNTRKTYAIRAQAVCTDVPQCDTIPSSKKQVLV